MSNALREEILKYLSVWSIKQVDLMRKYNINSLLAKTLNRYQVDISLDTLLKENSKMVQSMDKERAMGIIKHEKSKSDKKVVQYIKGHD